MFPGMLAFGEKLFPGLFRIGSANGIPKIPGRPRLDGNEDVEDMVVPYLMDLSWTRILFSQSGIVL